MCSLHNKNKELQAAGNLGISPQTPLREAHNLSRPPSRLGMGWAAEIGQTDFGRRAFSSAAPQIWNHIPTAIRGSQSLDSFKRHIKTHYFASP